MLKLLMKNKQATVRTWFPRVKTRDIFNAKESLNEGNSTDLGTNNAPNR